MVGSQELQERCAQLELELDRFRRCLAQSPAILAFSDRELRYVWIYDPHRTFDSERILGKTDVELSDEPGTRALRQLKRRVLETGEELAEEIELQIDGKPRIYEVSAAPLRLDGGAVAGVRTVARDVTRRRRALDELGRSRDEQVQLVSHDLRQPLEVISMAAAVVASGAEPGSLLETAGDRILSSVRAMAETLDDLLEAGALEAGGAGGLALRLQGTELGRLVREVLERSFCAPQVARVSVQAPSPVVLAVDRVKLGRAIQNLVHNALKFSPDDTPVVVGLQREEGQVTITVHDEGQGMSAETVATVFDKHRACASSKARGGRGLGLYVVRLIAEAHGGRCRADSRPGVGTTFSIELPLGDPPPAASRSSAPS